MSVAKRALERRIAVLINNSDSSKSGCYKRVQSLLAGYLYSFNEQRAKSKEINEEGLRIKNN